MSVALEKLPFNVGISLISGQGVFANRNIKLGELVCYMSGEEVTRERHREIIRCGLWVAGDALQIDDNLYCILEERYRVINHSCEPNAYVCGKNSLTAMHDIQKGEEITFDYSMTMWETHANPWSMKCNCLSKKCRGLINQFYDLPQELQNRYIEKKYVQDFIIKNKLIEKQK